MSTDTGTMANTLFEIGCSGAFSMLRDGFLRFFPARLSGYGVRQLYPRAQTISGKILLTMDISPDLTIF
ncbi:hypothetical protein [Sphingopyxis sp. BSNA05]|uniref:hypothetical protein n=1 Tax=Sphingopyxis sp. BSNA05 TaxID=1236614 RepID=UPI0015646459|nr:hypothetical protein [Sphingopyxis sp. BSNA05]